MQLNANHLSRVPQFGFAPSLKNYSIAVISGLLLLQGASNSLAATSVDLSVPASWPWTDTGIDVMAGTMLNITASGTVIYGSLAAQTTGPDGGNYTGPNYFSDAVLPSTFIVSLIGKIGGTTDVGTGTPVPEGIPGKGPGFVGPTYSEIIPTSGRLFLGFNDRVPYFGDNSGSFTVTVTVPEPSSFALAGLGIPLFYAVSRKPRTQTTGVGGMFFCRTAPLTSS